MGNAFDLVIIGHMAIDTVINIEQEEEVVQKVSPGGTVTFASLAVKTSNPDLNVGFLTKIGPDMPAEFINMFREKEIDCSGIVVDENAPTTRFNLVYRDAKRTVSCPAKCSDILVENFSPACLDSKRFHLGPICREIKDPFIDAFGQIAKDSIVGIDLQGFIRHIHPDGRIDFIPKQDGRKTVKKLYDYFGGNLVIKGDDFEMASISNITDPLKTMDFMLAEFPEATILITLGRKGSWLGKNLDGKQVKKIPAYLPTQIVDETGAGDTYLSTFLSRLDNPNESFEQLHDAAHFAAAASSYLVEDRRCKGLQSKEKILERIAKGQYMSL
jgi:sugar/nucleoside kinase (ribokinase family)